MTDAFTRAVEENPAPIEVIAEALKQSRDTGLRYAPKRRRLAIARVAMIALGRNPDENTDTRPLGEVLGDIRAVIAGKFSSETGEAQHPTGEEG